MLQQGIVKPRIFKPYGDTKENWKTVNKTCK